MKPTPIYKDHTGKLKGLVYYFDGTTIQRDEIDTYEPELCMYFLKGTGNLHHPSELFKSKTELRKML